MDGKLIPPITDFRQYYRREWEKHVVGMTFIRTEVKKERMFIKASAEVEKL